MPSSGTVSSCLSIPTAPNEQRLSARVCGGSRDALRCLRRAPRVKRSLGVGCVKECAHSGQQGRSGSVGDRRRKGGGDGARKCERKLEERARVVGEAGREGTGVGTCTMGGSSKVGDGRDDLRVWLCRHDLCLCAKWICGFSFVGVRKARMEGDEGEAGMRVQESEKRTSPSYSSDSLIMSLGGTVGVGGIGGDELDDEDDELLVKDSERKKAMVVVRRVVTGSPN